MTTRRVAIHREQVKGWPIFHGLTTASDLAAISVEVTRPSGQPIDQAVENASGILRSSLAAARIAEQLKFVLVVAGAPIKPTERVAAYRAKRERVWGVLERQDISIPAGPRRDLEYPLADDRFGHVGSIEFELSDLEAALRVTRRTDAVCVATHPLAEDLLPSLAPALAQRIRPGSPGLLVALVQLHVNWAFTARAFGQFDDHLAGVEVIASDAFLDILEPIMLTEANTGPDHRT